MNKPGASDTSPAVTASFLGWMLDAFDYFLVIYCLTAIGKEFQRTDKEMAVSILITLAFRPVGAFIFGLLADRYGRRIPLMIDLVFYSAVEVATAFAPGYASFLVLRALFGIGMGGEWGVGASLAMEKVSPRFRGLASGLLQQGYAAGNLLAALCYFFLFNKWGWRPMFLLGGLPALLALFVRMRVKESEVWEAKRKVSFTEIARTAASHWKVFLFMVLLMSFMNFSSHGTQDMYPTFLQRFWHFDAPRRSLISAIASVGAILGGTAFGLYSDRKGRRRAIVTALILAILAIPLWAKSPTTPLLIAGAFLMQFMVQGAWGVIPAHLSELSPDSVRGFLPGFAYQCGVLISGSIVYIQALFAETMDYSTTMALTAGVVFAGAALVAGLGRERHGPGIWTIGTEMPARVEYAHERVMRTKNKPHYRVAHWPIWIWVFFLAPGPLTFDLFAKGPGWGNMVWLAVVLVCTGIAGVRGKLPGVEPAPYILRFTEDRPNPLYRKVCYTFAWADIACFALLNLAGLLYATLTGHWILKQIYLNAYFPLYGTVLLLGALGLLPRVGRSTKGEGTERRYFYGSVWAVTLAQTMLLVLWKTHTPDWLKLAAYASALLALAVGATMGLLPRTRPILPGEVMVAD